MSWRYQPVWTEDAAGRCYSLIAVYFDEAGRLTKWGAEDAWASGETQNDLSADLSRMIIDALCWVPVEKSKLGPGVIFEKRVSMEDREALCDFIEETKEAVKRQVKPVSN